MSESEGDQQWWGLSHSFCYSGSSRGWSYATVTVLIVFHKYSASNNERILCVIVARL